MRGLGGGPTGTAAIVAIVGLAVLAPRALAAGGCDLTLRGPDGAPLADAVLYALPADGRTLPPPVAAVMNQRHRKFVPHVLVVQTHARVVFRNSDDVSHHVYSFSPAKRFQLYLAKGEPEKTVVFDQPGVVTLGCNLHDWMLGYILVVDTPWFAKTDASGRASLPDLAPGRYRLEVWHPRATDAPQALARDVEVRGAAPAVWDLRLARPLLPARDQTPGLADYGSP